MTHPIREAVARAIRKNFPYMGYTPEEYLQRCTILGAYAAIEAMRPVIEAAYKEGAMDMADKPNFEGAESYATRIIAELTGNPPKTP